ESQHGNQAQAKRNHCKGEIRADEIDASAIAECHGKRESVRRRIRCHKRQVPNRCLRRPNRAQRLFDGDTVRHLGVNQKPDTCTEPPREYKDTYRQPDERPWDRELEAEGGGDSSKTRAVGFRWVQSCRSHQNLSELCCSSLLLRVRCTMSCCKDTGMRSRSNCLTSCCSAAVSLPRTVIRTIRPSSSRSNTSRSPTTWRTASA